MRIRFQCERSSNLAYRSLATVQPKFQSTHHCRAKSTIVLYTPGIADAATKSSMSSPHSTIWDHLIDDAITKAAAECKQDGQKPKGWSGQLCSTKAFQNYLLFKCGDLSSEHIRAMTFLRIEELHAQFESLRRRSLRLEPTPGSSSRASGPMSPVSETNNMDSSSGYADSEPPSSEPWRPEVSHRKRPLSQHVSVDFRWVP